MAATVSQPSVSRPVPVSASKTYVTCAPVPAYSATILMETQEQQPQKAHTISSSLTITSLNATTKRTPPFARHSRPAGASPRCQDAPLDLTKPLDLSVKKKRPRSAERTCDKSGTKCFRQIPTDGLACKNNVNPAVVTPFNFASVKDTIFGRPAELINNSSSRRTGLIGSSPRNYNYRGKAVVAPRRDQTPKDVQYLEQQRQFADLQRQASTFVKHGHVPVSSVPYSQNTHPFSKSSTLTRTVSSLSSSEQVIPSSHQSTSSSPYRSVHHRTPILPNTENKKIVGNVSRSVSASISEKHSSPARIAHVTAFSRTSTSGASKTASSQTQSPASSSYNMPAANFTVGVLQSCQLTPSFPSSQHMFSRNLSNGASSIQKTMRRSHSVSPMRLSRSTYAKGNGRHNVRVLKMLDSTIAAGAKITKFLPPIDGPDAPRILSGSAVVLNEDSNNNSNGLLVETYTQPLQVDIPDHHSPSAPPPLPHAFGDDRLMPDHVESASFCSGNQLSPPPSVTARDRISPTMPVLVPHSMYSPPGELQRPDAADCCLPVLKKAKLDATITATQPMQYNPLTLPFMSSVPDSKKVQSVPPIISQPRQREDERYERHSVHQSLHRSSVERRHAGTQSIHEDARNIGKVTPPSQKDLEDLLMQLDRKAVPSSSVQRATFRSASASVSPPLINSAMSSRLMFPNSKSDRHTVDRTLRSLEEDREIMRRLLYRTAGEKGKLLERPTLISIEQKQKQEPEIVDLTTSPPPSPTELKVEQPTEQHEQTGGIKKHTPHKIHEAQPFVTATFPESKDTSRESSLFRTPSFNVTGKALTMNDVIEIGLKSYRDEQNAKRLLESKSDCARPTSKTFNSKSESDSKENHESKGDQHTFCTKHRRLLFPPSKTPNHEVAKTEVLYKPRSPTIHDPRKKHLASLKREDNVSPPQSGAKENFTDYVTTAADQSSSEAEPISPSLSNAEQRRRPRLNLEINRIANTASYVGDLPKKPRSGDLLVDSSLLDREERALQRAMLRFSEMEQQARFDLTSNSNNPEVTAKPSVEPKRRRTIRGRPPRGRGRGLNRAAKLVKAGRRRRFPWRLRRLQIAKRESPRKRKAKVCSQLRDRSADTEHDTSTKFPHKFLDFKPEILQSRTRNETNNPLVTDRPICSVENSTVAESPDEAILPKYGERGRNSVRKRLPYHKNARYELEIEKEEAKLVERKRKRTVSYSSNSGADTTDDSPVVTPVSVASEPMIKRKRGRPRKTESERILAAKKREMKIRFKGVGRGKYPRIKKKTKPMTKRTSNFPNENEQTEKSIGASLPSIKDDLQRPLQVVMDPDNHTKMKFVSLKVNTKVDTSVVKVKEERVCGKRKRKTKHLGPVSPSQDENIENCKIAKCGDETDLKIKTENDGVASVDIQHIKQEPEDPEYEPAAANYPALPQVVRPDPPADLRKFICNKKLGETLLHRACRMARDDVAIYCIDYQMCDINAKDNAGYTPLHECCVNDRLKVAEHLLRHGADVNASAADGTRPIHDAVDNHRMDIVRLLLAFGADPLVATYSGRTALKLARNREMKSFIIGYLRDVNGEWELDEEEYPDYANTFQDTEWRFRHSLGIPSDCISEVEEGGVFGTVPNDESQEVDSADDILFEMSETPHLQTYNLQLARDNGPRNWLLETDVRGALGGKFDDIINTCEDVQPITITRREFNYALREGLTSLPADLPPKQHGHVSDSESVELVELNDRLRQALEIETEFVS